MSLPGQSMPMGLHQHDQYTTYFEGLQLICQK
jgi:hypothetical protein